MECVFTFFFRCCHFNGSAKCERVKEIVSTIDWIVRLYYQVIKYSLFDGGGGGSNDRSIQPIFFSSFFPRKFKSIVSRKSGGFVRPRDQFSIQRLPFTIRSVNNAIECVAAIGLVFRNNNKKKNSAFKYSCLYLKVWAKVRTSIHNGINHVMNHCFYIR